ncbi:FHA domain-containing protein [bacterium]|nr:FHA domain-containing protein [bacterium]
MPEIIVKLGDQVVQRYQMDKDVASIGRARDNDIVVENLSVSRNHARIRQQDGKYILTDLNSANGSFVNGVKITKTELVDEDIISIGKHKLHFINKPVKEVAEEEAPPAPALGSPDEITSSSPRGVLTVTRGKQLNQEFNLTKVETSIGRANENEIRLHDWFVSKKHAVIVREGTRYKIKDLGSWRGTTVNSNQVREAELKDGDELLFGTTLLRFNIMAGTPRDIPGFEPEPVSAPSEPEPPEQWEDEPSGVVVEAGEQEPERITLDDGGPDTVEEVEKVHETPPPPGAPVEDDSVSLGVEDDEFAPMTDEELEDLERQVDEELGQQDEDMIARAEFEQIEAERMLEEGGGMESRRKALFEEEDQQEAEAEELLGDREPSKIEPAEEAEEEPDSLAVDIGDEEEAAEEAPAEEPAATESADESFEDEEERPAPVLTGETIEVKGKEYPVPEGVEPDVVRRWARGLHNRSKVIRREASRKLKDLTGIDYEWESQPE